jgi:outer membrane lipoprotein SlyB
VGAVLGDTIGGAVGSRADKEDRPVAVVLGTVIGAKTGQEVTKAIERAGALARTGWRENDCRLAERSDRCDLPAYARGT